MDDQLKLSADDKGRNIDLLPKNPPRIRKSMSLVPRSINENGSKYQSSSIQSTPRADFGTAIRLGLESIFYPKSDWYKIKHFDEKLRRKQSEEHRDRQLAFYYIVNDDILGLKRALNTTPSLIQSRDSFGGTIIHAAYWYERYAIGRWLVETYPEDALEEFSNMWDDKEGRFRPNISIVLRELQAARLFLSKDSDEEIRKLMPYTGQNILHMVIVRKNLAEIRWLLDFYRDHEHSIPHGLAKLLTGNATGHFYDPKGNYYLGGYPIHFAVCSNDKEIFDLVLTYASSTTDDEEEIARARTEAKAKRNASLSVQSKSFFSTSMRDQNSISRKEYSDGQSSSAGRARRALIGRCAIFVCDDHGNNVLHFCVRHQLYDMYTHVKMRAETILRREIKAAYSNHKRYNLPIRTYFKKLYSRSQILHCYPPFETVLTLPYESATRSSHTVQAREVVHDTNKIACDASDPTLLDTDESPETRDGEELSATALSSWVERAVKKKINERLLLVLNENLHSPLTLAVSIITSRESVTVVRGIREFIEYIFFGFSSSLSTGSNEGRLEFLANQLEQFKEVRWHFGPIKTSLLNLEGIEYPYDYRHYDSMSSASKVRPIDPEDMHSLLDWISRNHAEGAIMIPTIRHLLEEKWERVGYSTFLGHFYVHVLQMILITLLGTLAVVTPSSSPETFSEFLVTIIYAIIGAILFQRELPEVALVYKYGLDYWGMYGGIRSAARFEKFCRTAIFASFVSLCCIKASMSAAGHTNNDDNMAYLRYAVVNKTWVNVTLDTNDVVDMRIQASVGLALSFTICVFTSWMYLFFFLMGFDTTAPFVMMIYQIVSKDMPYFLTFFFVLLNAFGAPLAMMSSEGIKDIDEGIARVVYSWINLVQNAANLNLPQADTTGDITVVPRQLQALFEALYTLYYVFVVIMMLNLLIAMIGNTYNRYSGATSGLVLLEKYNMMASWERGMSERALIAYRKKYAIKIEGDLVWSNNNEEDSDSRLIADGEYHDRGGGRQSEVATAEGFAFEFQEQQEVWWESRAGTDEKERKMLKKKVALLLIDIQNDFHDSSETPRANPVSPELEKLFPRPPEVSDLDWLAHPQGSLAVPGANEDSDRIAMMIANHLDDITDIFVTMDSHHACHISHAVYWVDKAGNHPNPFTLITSDDVQKGVWRPAEKEPMLYVKQLEWCKDYTVKLEKGNRFKHCIWPEHCIIGSEGHNIVPVVNEALRKWTAHTGKSINFVMKGYNCRTEMYSAISAEVEDREDSATLLNEDLLSKLKISDQIIVCGQALSHCVRCTMEDIIKYWTTDLSRITLLIDGCSCVAGYEKDGEQFKAECRSLGVKLARTTDVFFDGVTSGDGGAVAPSSNTAPLAATSTSLKMSPAPLSPPSKLKATASAEDAVQTPAAAQVAEAPTSVDTISAFDYAMFEGSQSPLPPLSHEKFGFVPAASESLTGDFNLFIPSTTSWHRPEMSPVSDAAAGLRKKKTG